MQAHLLQKCNSSEPQLMQSTIKSYVQRNRRLTQSQSESLRLYWQRYGIAHQQTFDIPAAFNRDAPLVVEIGSGNGEMICHYAARHPGNNYLIIEIYRKGLGILLKQLVARNISNVRIVAGDAVDVLSHQLPEHSVDCFFVFFPDPWPKRRHHKRRLLNNRLIGLVVEKLTLHGRFYLATDCLSYAKQIMAICTQHPQLTNFSGFNRFAIRPSWRVYTRYEKYGLSQDHRIYNLCFAHSGIL